MNKLKWTKNDEEPWANSEDIERFRKQTDMMCANYVFWVSAPSGKADATPTINVKTLSCLDIIPPPVFAKILLDSERHEKAREADDEPKFAREIPPITDQQWNESCVEMLNGALESMKQGHLRKKDDAPAIRNGHICEFCGSWVETENDDYCYANPNMKKQ